MSLEYEPASEPMFRRMIAMRFAKEEKLESVLHQPPACDVRRGKPLSSKKLPAGTAGYPLYHNTKLRNGLLREKAFRPMMAMRFAKEETLETVLRQTPGCAAVSRRARI